MDGATGDTPDSLRSWLMVCLSFLTLTLIWGSLYTFSVFADTLAATFGLSSLRTTTLYSVEVLAFFGVGGTASILVSGFRVRRVFTVVAVLFAAGLAVLQVTDSYLVLTLLFVVFGSAYGTVYITILSVVPQWFERKQGLAMGLVIAGNGVGLLVMPFVWRWLTAGVGIRRGFLVVGGGLVGVYLLLALAFRRPHGTEPGTTPETGPTPTSSLVDRPYLAWLLRQRQFWLVFVGVGLLWAWYHVYAAHAVGMMTDAGISTALAASLFGLVGGISIPARVASGYLADRIGLRETLTLATVLVAVGFVFFLGRSNRFALYAATVLFAVGLGSQAALYSPLVIQTFGAENATAVMGIVTYAVGIPAFVAPILVSLLYEAAGTYTPTLLLTVGLTVLGAVIIWFGASGRIHRPRGPNSRSGATDTYPSDG